MMPLAYRRSQRFGQPEEHTAPRPKLRRADSDAGAVANLVLLVEEVDDIETGGERARARNGKQVRQAGVDLSVVGQVRAIRDARAAIRRGLARRQIEVRPQTGP